MSRSPLLALSFAIVTALSACASPGSAADGEGTVAAPVEAAQQGHEVAIVAGGCFWCVESIYDDLPGVVSAVSGYIAGPEQHPTYRQVANGRTGHTEAVRVEYDPAVISYERVIALFWRNIDPFQRDGQFCDHGPQYRTGIYPLNAEQRAVAERTKMEVATRFDRRIATEIVDANTFWIAEAYHQDFHHTNAAHYQRYRTGCGRDRILDAIWGAEARTDGGVAGG